MAKTSKTELTIALDGEVTARDLAVSAHAFAKLLDLIAATEAPGIPLEWIISDLRPGSSATTASCIALDPGARPWIPKVIAGGQRFAAAMEREEMTMPPPLQEVADDLRSLVKVRGRLIRVRFESPDNDYVLVGPRRTADVTHQVKQVAFGSVRGRVQAMSNHGSLRFTLYDINDGKGVSCYLGDDGEEDTLLGLWDKLVEVEGFVRRDPDTGRPLTVRKIAGITALRDGLNWRRGLGSLQGFLGDESSEDVIRRARGE